MLTGDKMKQDGGIRRKASIEGLDAKASPYGEYDARLIAAIQDRWYKIIPDVRDVGRVVITFTLWENGDVSDVEVERSTVSRIHSLKCERAVREPAPYDPWPAEMQKRSLGTITGSSASPSVTINATPFGLRWQSEASPRLFAKRAADRFKLILALMRIIPSRL